MKRFISTVVGIGVVSMTVAASAQTLADLAKKDTDRRKSVKHPAKVITNDDVQDLKPILPMMENDGSGTKPVDPNAAGAASATPPNGNADMPVQPGATPAPAVNGAAPAAGAEAKSAGTSGVKAGDEAAWRAKMQAAHDAVSRTQLQLEGMRNRAAQLTAASAAAADQDKRGSFQKQQQDALQEYDRLRADLQRNQKALSDLEAAASRAGVPPGWLR
jgi:hypothetical protein